MLRRTVQWIYKALTLLFYKVGAFCYPETTEYIKLDLIGSNTPAFPMLLKSYKNAQNHPEHKQFGEALGVFLFSVTNDRKEVRNAPDAKVSQEGMGNLS